uniref:FAE domain-containing protein n=1 Tax=Oryza glaberrima TaxID=4538 RepID=I1P0G2_ORYGL
VTRGRRLRAAASARSCGAAVLVTHDPALRPGAKMELGCLVRANIAANDDAHACALQREDDDGSGRTV